MADSAKPQRQPRALRTRAKMLSALERLLARKPFDQIAVAEIADEAGVAVGSVYSHFADKDAFLQALLEEWRARAEARLVEAEDSDLEAEFRAEGSLRGALHMIVAYNQKHLEEDKHLIRAVHDYLRQTMQGEWEGWRDLHERAFKTVAFLVDVFSDEIRRTDRDKAKQMLNYYLNVMFTERIVYGGRGRPGSVNISDEDFASEVAEMAYAYLTTEG